MIFGHGDYFVFNEKKYSSHFRGKHKRKGKRYSWTKILLLSGTKKDYNSKICF